METESKSTHKQLSEKEYKAHLKELGIDDETISKIWNKIVGKK